MKLLTWTPCGFTPLITWRMVPSLPAASIAWSTTSTPYVSWAASRAWYSARISMPWARIAFASALDCCRRPLVSKSRGSRTRRPGSTRNGSMNSRIRFGPISGIKDVLSSAVGRHVMGERGQAERQS